MQNTHENKVRKLSAHLHVQTSKFRERKQTVWSELMGHHVAYTGERPFGYKKH